MTTGKPPPAMHVELLLEHLERIQAELADVHHDVRELKANVSMQLALAAEILKCIARRNQGVAALDVRMGRIEHALTASTHETSEGEPHDLT